MPPNFEYQNKHGSQARNQEQNSVNIHPLHVIRFHIWRLRGSASRPGAERELPAQQEGQNEEYAKQNPTMDVFLHAALPDQNPFRPAPLFYGSVNATTSSVCFSSVTLAWPPAAITRYCLPPGCTW